MRLRKIFITCPFCKEEFSDFDVISMQSENRKYPNDKLSGSRKCQNCGITIDIMHGNNVRYKPKSWMKRFKYWIQGHRYH